MITVVVVDEDLDEDGLIFAGEVTAVREHRPDVVLMDIRMPGIDGLEATRRITTDPELTQTKIIVLRPSSSTSTSTTR